MNAAASLNTTPLAIFAVVSLGLGYGGIWALWHFVFSPKRHHDDDIDQERRAALGALVSDPGSSDPVRACGSGGPALGESTAERE